MTERLPITRTVDGQPLIQNLIDRLRPILGDSVVRAVQITYWRDGDDRPLYSWVVPSSEPISAQRILSTAPGQATHLTIETPPTG